MLILNLLGFFISCIILIKSSGFTIKSLSSLAKLLRISEFLISFVIVGFITALPETSVAIISAINKVPEIGFGALLGSNIADLSLVLGIIALFGRKINIRSKTMLHELLYIVLTLIPLILAYDGVISRNDGIILITFYGVFILHLFKKKHILYKIIHHYKDKDLFENLIIFLGSILILYFSAHYVIKFAQALSIDLSIPVILIALILIGLGTCLPELLVAIKSIKLGHINFGLGEILGNVIIDATLMLGITALIHPIILEKATVLITGSFLILNVLIPLSILRYRKALTQRDGLLFIFIYILFVFVELSVKGVS